LSYSVFLCALCVSVAGLVNAVLGHHNSHDARIAQGMQRGPEKLLGSHNTCCRLRAGEILPTY